MRRAAGLVAGFILRRGLRVVLNSIHETGLLLFGGSVSVRSLGATVGTTVSTTTLPAAGANQKSDDAAKTHDEAAPNVSK